MPPTVKQKEIMKLELKHIAPYLPYELEVKDPETVVPGVMVAIVAGMPGLIFYEDKDTIEYFDLSAIKPMLIPMTELKSERLLKLSEWLYGKEGESFDSMEDAGNWITMILLGELQNIPYGFVEKLISEYFDVFGLIDAGLAINKLLFTPQQPKEQEKEKTEEEELAEIDVDKMINAYIARISELEARVRELEGALRGLLIIKDKIDYPMGMNMSHPKYWTERKIVEDAFEIATNALKVNKDGNY